MISLHNQRRQSKRCPILSRQKVRHIQSFVLVRIYQVKHLGCLLKRVTNIIWRLFTSLNMLILYFRLNPSNKSNAWRLRLNNRVETLSWFRFVIMQKFWICRSTLWRCLSWSFCQMWLMFMKHFHLKFMMIFAFPLYFKPTMQVQVSNPQDFSESNWNHRTNIWIQPKCFNIISATRFWKQVLNCLSTNMNFLQNPSVRVFTIGSNYIELSPIRKYISSKIRFSVMHRQTFFQRITIAINRFMSFRIFPQPHFECKFTKLCLHYFMKFTKRFSHTKRLPSNFVRLFFVFPAFFWKYQIKKRLHIIFYFFFDKMQTSMLFFWLLL